MNKGKKAVDTGYGQQERRMKQEREYKMEEDRKTGIQNTDEDSKAIIIGKIY